MAPVSQHSLPRLLIITACAVILTACGSTPAKTGDGEAAESSSAGDTKSGLMSVGADIGCGIASILKKDCAKGAAVGSRIVDKAISWVFKSLKIADGKTVNKEYEAKKEKVSKTEVKPMAFTTHIQTTDSAPLAPESKSKSKAQTSAPSARPAEASSEIKVTSSTDLVGYGDKVPVVTQRYALYDEKNKLISSQTEKVAAVDGAGRYETEAKVKIPKSNANKHYRVETTLVVDGKDYKKNAYKVSAHDNGALRLAFVTASATL